jgi:hypothetical protein
MWKKKLFISTMTIGLLAVGIGMNISNANADTGRGNYLQTTGLQAKVLNQNQSQMTQPQFMMHFLDMQQKNMQQNNMQQNNMQQNNMRQNDMQQNNMQQQSSGEALGRKCQIFDSEAGNILSQIADILGVEEKSIIETLQGGKTLVEIAEDNGVDEDELLEELVESQTTAINNAVSAGTITDEQADELKDKLTERMQNLIEYNTQQQFNGKFSNHQNELPGLAGDYNWSSGYDVEKGTISNMDSDSITINDNTYQINDDTKIYLDQKSADWDDISEGDSAVIFVNSSGEVAYLYVNNQNELEVESLSPSDDADNVSRYTDELEVKFNRDIEAKTSLSNVYDAITISNNIDVNTVEIDDDTLTIKLDDELDYNEEYTVTIDSGVIQAEDSSDTNDEIEWSFTTEEE